MEQVYLPVHQPLGLLLLGPSCRGALAVFAAFGICGYLGHLAYDVFEDSLMFPFVLTLLGSSCRALRQTPRRATDPAVARPVAPGVARVDRAQGLLAGAGGSRRPFYER